MPRHRGYLLLRSGSADELCFASPAGRTSEPQSQGYSRYRSCWHEVVSRVSADSSLRGRVLLDHAPGKLAKRQTRLQIHRFIEIRLREDRERVPRDLASRSTIARVDTPDEMGYGLEFAMCDELEGLASLEG